MSRIKILLFNNDIGFKKLNVTEKQVKLLSLLHRSDKLKGIEFFDMREVSPIDERIGNYINVGNVDFSFHRVLSYFKEPMNKITIVFNDGHKVAESVTSDRLEYLKEDMKDRQNYVIKIG